MTKNDLIEKISNDFDFLKKSEIKDLVESVFMGIEEGLMEEGEVKLTGFGNFEVKTSAPRQARNPKTGEIIQVPEKKTVKFKASNSLKSKFN